VRHPNPVRIAGRPATSRALSNRFARLEGNARGGDAACGASDGVVHDASLTNRSQFETVKRAAAALGREAISLEIDGRRQGVAGLIFVSTPVFTANAARVVDAVHASGLPARGEQN
jgi:hypothetical protein